MNNAVNYLRTRNGLTMAALSAKTGICTADIERLEQGSERCALSTYQKIERFFGVPLAALMVNDIVEIMLYVLNSPNNITVSKQRMLRRNVGRMKSGNAGQDAALEYEVLRHLQAGGKHLKHIDPSPAEKPSNGYEF